MTGKKMKLGVIGYPIHHSLSPVMHKAAFRELGMEHEYDVLEIKPGDLEGFMEAAADKFFGLNVTIPYKQEVMEHLDKVGKDASLVGAVNTIKFTSGKSAGYNTDGTGCVAAFREKGVHVKGSRILVLGAGGAARGIAFHCVLEGAKVSIANRGIERARKLSEDIKGALGTEADVLEMNEEDLMRGLRDSDILINATSVGMAPRVEEMIIPENMLPSHLTVMDIVYNPLETRLLREARDRGCETIDGVGMLVHQGAESFRIWFDVEPPVEAMRAAVLKELSRNHG